MKTKTNYSDCFYQVRNSLRAMLKNDFESAKLFTENNKVMDFALICQFADDLTAFNEISGLPFFEKFNRFGK